MTCENCGGQFEETLPRCPYCGGLNYIGAEREYLEKLEDVREDMDDMRNHPKEEYTAEVVRHGRRIKGIFIATAVLILGAFLVVWIGSTITSMGGRSEDDKKAQLLWEQEVYPQLDAWYEAGDYEAIAEFQRELYRDNSDYSMYTWSHSDFSNQYMEYYYYGQTRARWDTDVEITGYEIGEVLSSVAYYHHAQDKGTLQLTKKDVALCDGYIAEQTEFLIDELGFTQTELDDVCEQMLADVADGTSLCYDIGDEKEKELYD